MEEPEDMSEAFEVLSNDLESPDNSFTKVEQEPEDENQNTSKRRKIEEPEETHQNLERARGPIEKLSKDLNSQDNNLKISEKITKNEALNLYQKLYSLHQCSNSEIHTIAKDMEKEMHNVLCKYKEEVRKKDKVKLLEARNKALSQYIKTMNEVVNDASQQVLDYLPDITIKAGHEKSKKESLKHYHDLIKSDCRLTSESNLNEFEKILEEKFRLYLKVNNKKESSALLKVKLRCISEYLSRLNNLIKSNNQKKLLVNILRTSQEAILNEILDLYKKLTVGNSVKVQEMKVEIEKAVDNKFQQFVYQYEKQEVASLKHTCLNRYCEDVDRIAGKEGVPFISEAKLQSAHRKIEDDIVQYYKKQTMFDNKLSNEAKAGLEEIKQEINNIFDNKVKENLEEEKVCVMEAKYISIYKYTTTMNQVIKESNDDFITNVKLGEKHEEAKDIALRFYREANHFDKQHPSEVALKTLKELEDNELDSKLKDYEEQNIIHQKSILYMIKSEAINEYKEALKSSSNIKLDSNLPHDTQERAFEKALKFYEEKSFSEIDSTEQTEIIKKKLIKEMQNHLHERMHILYIMNPGYSLKKNISTKNKSEDANLMKNKSKNHQNKEQKSPVYDPSGAEIVTMLEKFPFAEVDLIQRTLRDYRGNLKLASNKLIHMGYELQDEDLEERDDMSVEESYDNEDDEIERDQDEVSDSDVLKLSSAGLSLQGVIIKDDCDDWSLSRQLLEAPNNCILRTSNMSERNCCETFFSKMNEEDFKQNLETKGYSATVLRKYIGTRKSLSSQGQYGSDITADDYYSQIKYTVFPIKSYYADVENMHMTKDAIKALQAIEVLSKVSTEKLGIQKDCEEFFSEFGSHVCTGNIHFGSIMWDNNCNIDHKTEDFQFSKFLKKNWSVVDRGFAFQGIWHILENHKYFFQNSKKLAITLQNCWSQWTGMNENQAMFGLKHLSSQGKLQEISHLVDEGIKDPKFPQNCKRYIEAVLGEVKELVISLKLSSISKNKSISEFLLYVLKGRENYDDSDIINIKSLLKQLLYYLGNGQLKGKEDILQWIKGSVIPNISQIALEVSDFFHFKSMVEEHVISVLDACDENSKDDGKIVSAMKDLVFCAKHQESMLKQCEDDFSILLLKILLLPLNYNDRNKSLDSTLNKKMVQSFINNIKEKSSKLIKVKEDGVKSTEACLLQTLIDTWQEDEQTSEKEEYYRDIVENMKYIFSPETKEILGMHGNLPIDWKKLESAVQSIRYGMSLENIDCDIIGKGLLELIESTVDTENRVDDHQDIDQNVIAENCDILDKLGLIPYYPGKIELKDVMLNSPEKLDTLTDIPWFVFHKLLTLDYKGRNSMKFPADDNLGKQLPEKSEKTNEDVLMDIFSEIDGVSMESNSSLAPMDVVVAIYLCSTSFLKQTLAEKLFMCRLSIPLILPDIMDTRPTFLLWSLRNVIAEFELNKDKVIENSVVSQPFPIVSFIRLGDLARSKSKLMNDIISSQAHSVFFHRDCDNSTIHQELSGGLVDVAWFLSSKKQDHLFKEPIAFMNLHGNGNKYTEQCQFLCKVSNLISLMVDVEDLANMEILSTLKKIVQNETEVLYIFTKKSDKLTIKESQESVTRCFKEIGAEKINRNNVILDFNKSGSRTASEMKMDTVNKICTCLIGKGGITLESCKKKLWITD